MELSKNKYLIILRGVPGSGKTTVAELLSESGKYPICTADDYFMDDGEYKWTPSLLGRAHLWCQEKCRKAMESGIEKVFVANTNTKEKDLNIYVKIAQEFNYKVISLVIENRHGGKNIHNVPDDVLTRMDSEIRNSLKLK
jgi:predicted kinase